MAVIGVDDRDDLAPLLGVPGGLERDVDGLGATRAVHGVLQPPAAGRRQPLGQRGAGERREVMVADVEALGAAVQHLDQLGVAMPEIVGAAVEMHVDQPAAIHIEEQVALAAVDHQIDAHVLPGLGLARVPEGLRLLDEFLLLGAGHLRRSLAAETGTAGRRRNAHAKWPR
jgi:hypothetical protein